MKLIHAMANLVVAGVLGQAAYAESVPTDASAVRPLLIGATVPDVQLRSVASDAFALRDAVKTKPTVVIFYRGGWCPFCNTHLGKLQEIQGELAALGYQVLAISPDRPEKLAESAVNREIGYTLLSDSKMNAARAFGIAFQVDAATVAKYRDEYEIDLEADSGEKHHQLPVPAAFVVDTDGVIAFSYVNPDYKQRIDPQLLLAAARAALDGSRASPR